MKTKSIITKGIAILILVIGLGSCEDFLREVPDSFITPENFYLTEADAYAATIAAYSMLNSHDLFNNHLWPTIDMIADDIDLRPGELTPDLVLLENYRFGPSDADRPTVNYNGCYYGIRDANIVISRVSKMEINETLRTGFVAEARFLRALYYFYLVRMFGDVPKVMDETRSLDSLKIPRSPAVEIYQEIIVPDLQFAEEHLKPTAPEPGRATIGAAKSLLASVYLTMAGEPLSLGIPYYTLARDKALEVKDMNRYDLFTDFAEAFDPKKKNGIEHVFDVQFDKNIPGKESIGMWLHWPRNIGLGNGLGLYMPSKSLMNSFEKKDKRITVTWKTEFPRQKDGRIIKFPAHIWKFYDQETYEANNIPKASNNFPIIRYSEVLLIIAEAENEVSGPTGIALDAINKVRIRAGLDGLSGISQDALRDSVFQERRHEFVAECKKWFDLIRTGRFLEAMTANGKLVEEKHKLFPIPQRERDVNDLMTQNPGYN
ncbi:MAG: RagB/SusD family nutrient uptake outer membrane protein [Bacteroidales bacterium]